MRIFSNVVVYLTAKAANNAVFEITGYTQCRFKFVIKITKKIELYHYLFLFYKTNRVLNCQRKHPLNLFGHLYFENNASISGK